MRIVTQKLLKRFHKGKELSQIEFLNVNRSSASDEIAREILQADPNLVLKVLQVDEQASQSLKENFLVAELREMQA